MNRCVYLVAKRDESDQEWYRNSSDDDWHINPSWATPFFSREYAEAVRDIIGESCYVVFARLNIEVDR